MNQIKSKYITIYTLLFILVYMLFFKDYWKPLHNTNDTPFQYDVDQYYSYLPATFVHHDLDFKFPNYYWLATAKNGHRVPKMTYGMALMYSPFFALGYKIAYNTHSPLDGYSEPFKVCVHYGSFFYCFLGLIILAFVLRRFFSDGSTALTLATLFFVTNLFNYTMRDGEMSHAYGFFLISLFIWLTIKWHEKQKSIYFLWIGMTLGLASLVRPTEILIAIIFIGYGVRSFSGLKDKFKLVLFSYKNIPLLLLGFFILWLPQLIFWKMKTDHFFFFSYGEETFFWTDPQIMNLLFSYRKGWFIYTPVMLFAIAGLFMLKDKAKDFKWPIIIYMCLNIYILSCWWCWWYGGSFGMRALIQCYALLAIPMAAFYEHVFSFEFKRQIFSVITRSVIVLCLCLFLFVNQLQTIQFGPAIIHFDSMSKETYWLAFGKFNFGTEDWQQQQEDLIHPNYEEAMKGKCRN
ncbi:MAG: glycosyltransferase family 39 protein [Bacteroidia bacterium]